MILIDELDDKVFQIGIRIWSRSEVNLPNPGYFFEIDGLGKSVYTENEEY